MRSPTKAQAILNEARQRVEQARDKVTLAQQEVITATQVLAAYESIYATLEKSLARAPRKVTKRPAKDADADSAAERARKVIAVKDPICDVCGNVEDHSDHDKTYLSSHPFVPSVGKKSARKTPAKALGVNLGTGTDDASNAASVDPKFNCDTGESVQGTINETN